MQYLKLHFWILMSFICCMCFYRDQNYLPPILLLRHQRIKMQLSDLHFKHHLTMVKVLVGFGSWNHHNVNPPIAFLFPDAILDIAFLNLNVFILLQVAQTKIEKYSNRRTKHPCFALPLTYKTSAFKIFSGKLNFLRPLFYLLRNIIQGQFFWSISGH